MIWRVRSLAKRWREAIGNQLPVWPVPDRSRSLTTQAVAAGAAFLLSFWVTITSVSYFASGKLLSEAHERIRVLQQASAELSHSKPDWCPTPSSSRSRTWRCGPRNEQAAIAELTGTNTALQDRLAAHERQLASVSEQRNHARGLVEEMQQAIAGAEHLVGEVAEERLALQRRLAVAPRSAGAR